LSLDIGAVFVFFVFGFFLSGAVSRGTGAPDHGAFSLQRIAWPAINSPITHYFENLCGLVWFSRIFLARPETCGMFA